MLTIFDDDDYVYEALNDGASGYLLKNMKPKMLVSAIRAVHDGAILISPALAHKLFQHKLANDPPVPRSRSVGASAIAARNERVVPPAPSSE